MPQQPRKRPKPRVIVVKIAGQPWRVKRQKLSGVYGECDYAKRIITIDSAAPLRDQWATFIHETIHASAPDLSEDCVRRLEADIVAVLTACREWL